MIVSETAAKAHSLIAMTKLTTKQIKGDMVRSQCSYNGLWYQETAEYATNYAPIEWSSHSHVMCWLKTRHFIAYYLYLRAHFW